MDILHLMDYIGEIDGYRAFLAVLGGLLLAAAVVTGIVLQFTVFSERHEGEYTGRKKRLYDFFNFRSRIIKPVLKLLYCVVACLIAASSVVTLLSGGWGIVRGIVGFFVLEIVARVVFELLMLAILLVTSVMDIGRKMGGSNEVVDFAVQPDASGWAARFRAARAAYRAAAHPAAPAQPVDQPVNQPAEQPAEQPEEETAQISEK